MPVIDEIIVTAQRLPDYSPDVVGRMIAASEQNQKKEKVSDEKVSETSENQRAFVPPVLPAVIEEIIVTAKKPILRTGINVAGIWWTAGALLVASFIDKAGENLLEEAYQGFVDRKPRPKDSPVRTMDPEPIPEIIVTAKRQPKPYRPMVLPFEFWSPDADPFFLPTVQPRFTEPDPEVVPQIDVAPPEQPSTEPEPEPTLIPIFPQQPWEFPWAFPQITIPGPVGDPYAPPVLLPFAPGTPPTTVPPPGIVAPPIVAPPIAPPQVAPPGQGTAPWDPYGLIRFPVDPLTSLDTATDFKEANAECPPCTKVDEEPDTPRSRCYKKLVKEGIYPSQDDSYNWNEIDCITGKEL